MRLRRHGVMTMEDWKSLATSVAAQTPQTELVWQAVVTVGEREGLGLGPHGERFIVPITGGLFWGGPAHPLLHGTVRAGGADRQVIRRDGVKQLAAVYEMQCHDGAVLHVDNRVMIDESVQPRYARSVVTVSAPDGPWSWLNRRVLVGTLQTLQPKAQAVLVRVFSVT
jgi:CubicO group peptidase (beta-lactamase class C family)